MKRLLMLAGAALFFGSVDAADDSQAAAIVSTAGSATLDRAVSAPSGVELVASQDDSSVSISVSRSSSRAEPVAGQKESSGSFTLWSMSASAPIASGSDRTQLATLDGLGNASSITLKISQFRVNGLRNPFSDPGTSAEALNICKIAHAAFLRKSGNEKVGPAEFPQCDDQYIKDNAPEWRRRYEQLFWKPDAVHVIWGGMARLGYNDFEFLDPATAAKSTQNETPWSAGGYVALNPVQWRSLVTLAFQYQQAFKEADSGVLCPAGGGPTPTTCVSGAVGSPVESHKKLLSLEARRAVDIAGISAGLALTGTYDFAKKVFGVELPLYLIRDKDDAFTGGIRVGWRDDTDDVTVGVFVGSAFALFN